MVRGCHPLAETGMNAKKLRAALQQLCDMQFIYKLKDRQSRLNAPDDIGIDLDGAEKILSMKPLSKVPSYNNFDRDPDEMKTKKKKINQDIMMM